MVPLRRLLSKLTVLALSASPATVAARNNEVPCTDNQATDEGDIELDDDVPIDREHIDPADAAFVLGRGLAKALSEMRELDAIRLSTTWALSTDPMRRAGIACALEWPFRLMPDRLILEHLSQDPDPLIRSACARAAWIRGIGSEWRA
jgi:hypothetical protein